MYMGIFATNNFEDDLIKSKERLNHAHEELVEELQNTIDNLREQNETLGEVIFNLEEDLQEAQKDE
jgi:hypothetical protein